MKKIMIVLLCAGLGIILMLDSVGVKTAAYNSIELCLNTIVPSLFAFLALSTFVISSGLVKGDSAVFILSMVGGYPVGAKLLADKTAQDPSYKKRAENMLMYCYCGSPALLIAICNLGLYVWLSNMLACLVFAVIYNIRRKPIPANSSENTLRLGGDLLVHSVVQAGNALYRICLMIILFGVGMRVLEFAGVMKLLPNWFYAFMEITNTVSLNAPPSLIAALTSIGGLCVIFQVPAVTGGRLKLGRFLSARIPIAALSAVICWFMTRNITIETIANQNIIISAAGSPIASVFLMIMSLILIKTTHYYYYDNKQHK